MSGNSPGNQNSGAEERPGRGNRFWRRVPERKTCRDSDGSGSRREKRRNSGGSAARRTGASARPRSRSTRIIRGRPGRASRRKNRGFSGSGTRTSASPDRAFGGSGTGASAAPDRAPDGPGTGTAAAAGTGASAGPETGFRQPRPYPKRGGRSRFPGCGKPAASCTAAAAIGPQSSLDGRASGGRTPQSMSCSVSSPGVMS